ILLVGLAGSLPTSIRVGGSEARWMIRQAQKEIVEAREETAALRTRTILAREELALGREKRAREILSEIGDPLSVEATIARSRNYPYLVADELMKQIPGASMLDPDFRDIISLPLEAGSSTQRGWHVLVQGFYALTLDGLSEMRYFARGDSSTVGLLFVVAD